MVIYKALLLDQTYENREIDPETGEEIIETISQRSLACLNANGELEVYSTPLRGVVTLIYGEPHPLEARLTTTEPIEPLPGGWSVAP